MVFATLSGNYPRPIPVPVENLRPARETCEQCHRPERFAGDLVRFHTTYATDESNTATTDVRVLRVGSGDPRVASDIHWHIASDVFYLTLDKERQEIGWVRVEGKDGTVTEYIDPAKQSEVAQLSKEKPRLMDCIDCHNRATHVFRSPNDLIDTKIGLGQIDGSLPYIKKQGLAVLDPPNPSLEQAYSRIDALKDFYRTTYPQVFEKKGAAIDSSLAQLKDVARLTTFPDMKVNWKTYVSYGGHTQSPGCFRCHGKLVATSGDQKGKTISADCQLCHYFQLPQTK